MESVEINKNNIISIKEINFKIFEISKSVCKIITKENNHGSGFFIKINNDNRKNYFLMTNAHIVTKEKIEANEEIEIKYNYNKKLIKINLDKNKRYIKCFDDLDITLIEIIPIDKIKEKYFLSTKMK